MQNLDFLITTFCSAVHIMFAATPQTLTAYPKPGCICPCTFCKRRFKISESIFIVYQLNRLWLYTFCREIQCIIFRKSGGIFFSQTELFFIQVVFVQQPSGFPKAHRVMFFFLGKSKAFYFTTVMVMVHEMHKQTLVDTNLCVFHIVKRSRVCQIGVITYKRLILLCAGVRGTAW